MKGEARGISASRASSPWRRRALLPAALLLGALALLCATPVAAQNPTSVTLSAAPNPVTEGSSVTITATLDGAAHVDYRVFTRTTVAVGGVSTTASNQSNELDFRLPNDGRIDIAQGETTGTLTAEILSDTRAEPEETLAISLGSVIEKATFATTFTTVSSITTKTGVVVRITDVPAVSLSAAPNPVTEGSSVTVTATLTAAAQTALDIPVTLTAGTAEPGDYGALSSIRIPRGSTTGTATITTTRDDDTDKETFTVALGTLPSGVTAGAPNSVTVTINDFVWISLSAAPNPVTEGSDVTITATASRALRIGTAFFLGLTADTAETEDYGTLEAIEILTGRTSGTGTITTNQDDDTDDETFTVSLAEDNHPFYRAGTPGSVTVTITDDDEPAVSLSAAPNPVTEGSDVTVTATLSAAVQTAVDIPVTLTAGTAEPGDYGALSSIRIPSGSTTGTATITTAQDPDADDETFTVALGALPPEVTAGADDSVTVTITDDDEPAVSLSAAPNPVTEGSSVTVTARLSATVQTAVDIPVTLTAGTAEPGDYGALSSIRIPSGSTTGTAAVTTAQDHDADDETFTVALGALPPEVTAGRPDSVTVTITDDDKPTVSLSAAPNPVTEGSDVTVTATLSAALSRDAVIPVTLGAGTAESDDHGTLASIAIGSGQVSGAGTIATNQDDDTDDETFTVALGALPSEVTAGRPDSVTVTITDDDTPTVSLSAAPNPVTEGSDVTVTATLSAALSRDAVIPVTLGAGTAESDDHGTLASIAIGSGQVSGAGTIATNQDDDTDDETFTVALGALPSEVTAGRPDSVTVTITDDDTPTVSLSAAPNPVTEGSDVTVTATLSAALSRDAVIPVTLGAGTAESDDHGTLASIAIGSGQVSGAGTIATNQDDDTDDETFTVALGALPSEVTAGRPDSVTVTITDDDTPTVSLSAAPNPVTEGSSVTVTARLSATVQTAVDIPVTLTAVTAETGDYGALSDIRIPSGSTTGTATITTAQDPDTDDETFTVALGALPPEVTAGAPDSVTVIITDDDTPTVSLSAAPNPVTEGSSVTVTARLSATVQTAVDIPVTLTAVTAETGDYGALSDIRIPSGSTTGTATITTAQDPDTDDETFTVALGALPPEVTAGAPDSVTVIITDDDTPTVSLSAAPNPVTEGSSVTVTATLSAAVQTAVDIPVTLTAVTAETGDYGALSDIRIPSGSTTGTATITTAQDPDTDDETFTVALGALPPEVTAGAPDSVTVIITDDDTPTVSLSAAPNPVTEGSSVTVTATLSAAVQTAVDIPVTLTAVTAETGDYGALSDIRIPSGSATGTATITTAQDDDADDETFTVALGTLPPEVTAGRPDSVTVTITDDDTPDDDTPTVSLSAAPNPVTEGSDVTVTATLSATVQTAVDIPVTLTAGTAEPGDYGALSSIRIPSGATTGTAAVTTAQDDDADDETFTVALGALPPEVAAGRPSSVEVTIEDDDTPVTPPVLGAAEKAHVDKVGSALLGLGAE